MMQTHGLSVGIERIEDTFYLTLTIAGKLTHEDYQVITPLIDSAIEGVTQPKIKALVDMTQFNGWELRAAWDDFKLGLKHGNEFEKIAIITDKKWWDIAAKVGGWFVAGQIQRFESKQQALDWLSD